ncbi:hypothetical protein C2G38_2209395 [Gigaspora rosea]|uniref:Uncharacterized protein n=1 Tax=Gigaspora rosea TaxID=44941 RepID=A0A397UPE7_9GLOM|nr:hypothetical protein C2G38_2209395 [Gigaspora rosea]
MNLIFINTLNFFAADEIKNSPEMASYKDLLSFKEARNSLAELKHSFLWITKIANYHKLVSTAIFLDMKLNNVVIALNHKYDEDNKAYLMSIKKYHLILQYIDLPNQLIQISLSPKTVESVQQVFGIVPRPSIRNSDSKQNAELFIRDDIAVSSHGAHICKSGLTTHVTCGNVRAFGGIYIELK